MPGQTAAGTAMTRKVTSEGHNTMTSTELTMTADGLHDLLSIVNSDGGDQTLRLSAENSITCKKPCPALDFEELKLRLSQLTASKKSKPDPGVGIPDSMEQLAQATGSESMTNAPLICHFPSTAAPDGLTNVMSVNSGSLMPFAVEAPPTLGNQEQSCPTSVHTIEQTDSSQPTQPLSSATINDSNKRIIFPSASTMTGFPPVLDPHQLYAYLNALQSQAQLNPLDLLLLSAIQQGQHTVSYNDLYSQLLQQQPYAGNSPGFSRISPSLAVNPSPFLPLQNPVFSSLLFDWQMATMLAGLHGSSQTMMFAADQSPQSIPDVTPCDSLASSTPPLVKTINSITEQPVNVSQHNEVGLQNATLDFLSTSKALNAVENKQKEDIGTLVHNGKSGIQPSAPSSSQTLTAVNTINIPKLIF